MTSQKGVLAILEKEKNRIGADIAYLEKKFETSFSQKDEDKKLDLLLRFCRVLREIKAMQTPGLEALQREIEAVQREIEEIQNNSLSNAGG